MWRSRPSSRTHLAAAVLALLPAIALAQGGPPEIERISPATGYQGDLITLTGSGFDPDPEAHAVALSDGLGGVALTVVEASSTHLLCRLGGVPSHLAGDLRAATGKRVHLPDTVITFIDRLYVITDASWFHGEIYGQAGPFTALKLPLNIFVLGSEPDEGGGGCSMEVDTKPPETKIQMPIEIVTEGPSPESVPPDPPHRLAPRGSSNDQQMISARITVQPVLARPGSLSAEMLVADLAVILERTFGALGLTASAEADVLRVGYRYGAVSSFFVLEGS